VEADAAHLFDNAARGRCRGFIEGYFLCVYSDGGTRYHPALLCDELPVVRTACGPCSTRADIDVIGTTDSGMEAIVLARPHDPMSLSPT